MSKAPVSDQAASRPTPSSGCRDFWRRPPSSGCGCRPIGICTGPSRRGRRRQPPLPSLKGSMHTHGPACTVTLQRIGKQG